MSCRCMGPRCAARWSPLPDRIRGRAPGSFRREVIGAWLNFYVLAQTVPEAQRLLSVYQRRLRSNLIHGLKPLVGGRAQAVADGTGAMIDGVYIRQALGGSGAADGSAAAATVMAYVEGALNREGTA